MRVPLSAYIYIALTNLIHYYYYYYYYCYN